MTLQTLLDRFDLLMNTPESVPKLRRFILRLALQGRLTEQRKEDIDVNTLIERLRTEKQRLYDEGEIRKPRSLDPLDGGEEWHQVPFEWKWTKVGEVGRIIGGSTPRTSNDEYWADQGIAWLTPGDLGDHDGKMVARGDRDISEKGLDSCSATLLPPGSVLFSSRAPIGYVAIAADELSTNQGFKSVRPYEMAMSHYIYWFLKYAGKRINDEASGTTFTEVSGTDLANIPFPLPPLEEQQRIVQTVDGLMDECDALEEQQEREHALQVQVGTSATEALQSAGDVEALRPAWERVRGHFDTVTATPEGVDALRQTILQLAVQGRFTERNTEDKPASELVRKSSVEIQELYDSGKITKPSERPPVREEEKVFNLPDKWTWTRLGNVLALVNGRAYKKSELLDEGTPVIRIQNLTGGGSWYYTDLDLPPEKYCNTGDLLYTWSGTFGPHIWNGGKAVFHYHIWRIELTTGLTKQFAYHLLQAISADVEEDAHGIMLPHMTKGGMEKHPVPLPPLAEQKRIVETLDRLLPLFDRLSENVNQKSKRGEQLLKAALERASADQQDTVATGMAA